MNENLMDERTVVQAPVPLPTEVPPPPDLSQLPTHILHSGTVETLIGLNEDLLARLKINVRRNSILEQKIMEHERANRDLHGLNSSVTSQLQVFQEKDRILRDKLEHEERMHEQARNEIKRLKGMVGTLGTAHRYVRRVRKWIRPMIDRLMRDLQIEREARAARDAQVSDLRARLSETVQHVQSLEKRSASDQLRLVEQYENKARSLEEEIAKLKGLKDKAARFDEAISKRTELENKVIFLDRRATEIEKTLGAEIKELQNQTVRYRQEAKTLAADAAGREQELEDTKAKFQELQIEYGKLQDQFESLQAVWARTQKRLEESKVQQDAMNKLNQELSRQLRDSRKTTDSSSPSPEAHV